MLGLASQARFPRGMAPPWALCSMASSSAPKRGESDASVDRASCAAANRHRETAFPCAKNSSDASEFPVFSHTSSALPSAQHPHQVDTSESVKTVGVKRTPRYVSSEKGSWYLRSLSSLPDSAQSSLLRLHERRYAHCDRQLQALGGRLGTRRRWDGGQGHWKADHWAQSPKVGSTVLRMEASSVRSTLWPCVESPLAQQRGCSMSREEPQAAQARPVWRTAHPWRTRRAVRRSTGAHVDATKRAVILGICLQVVQPCQVIAAPSFARPMPDPLQLLGVDCGRGPAATVMPSASPTRSLSRSRLSSAGDGAM